MSALDDARHYLFRPASAKTYGNHDDHLRAVIAEARKNESLLLLLSAIDTFAAEIKSRVIENVDRKWDWDNPQWVVRECMDLLRKNAAEGDMVDVGAFATFYWNWQRECEENEHNEED